ncbi:hypothetical protein NB640_01375 [Oxalobacter vibrioformis]|uniref:Uncharacterized protein n=1 Tax=Oxalobacter vibrioformis TaxID=933080 RepID=A0A9E9LZ62_9BURK|nr:hypothetical protein [Oxalobacter vibrioformis]WAW10345.1 hypothetical protein NB640_01375 [Oxalobacter vibrioformis]
MTDHEIKDFDQEIHHLQQSGEEIVLIEVNQEFFSRLMKARKSAKLDLLSENNTYQGIKTVLSEDAEGYQFHIAVDDEDFEWVETPIQ